jgi:hypothetical protein
MESDNKKQSGWLWGWWLAVGLVALVIAYPLSAGPANWYLQHPDVSYRTELRLIRFYEPLSVAIDHVPTPVRNVYYAYVQWWSP